MTSLAVALTVDSRAPSAIYIISDSRLKLSTGQRWDFAQKTFASARTPDIFGFCGEALFPPMVLRQIPEQINSGLIFEDGADAAKRHKILFDVLSQYFQQPGTAPAVSLAIFHGARDGVSINCQFRLWETRYDVRARRWTDEERDLNTDKSYLAHVDGSGRDYVLKRSKEWVNTDVEGTSRGAIWSFCNALNEGLDASSGGPPQLVGIWRIGPARTFGYRWKGRAYLAGAEVPKKSDFKRVDWFNYRFERVDGRSGKKLEGAQKHPNPTKKKSLVS